MKTTTHFQYGLWIETGLAFLFCLFVIGLIPLIVNVVWLDRFWSTNTQIEAIVRRWSAPTIQNPDTVSEREMILIGFGNVCSSSNDVSIQELDRLLADVQSHDHEPIDNRKLEWLWNRLAKVGPHGKKYITQMQELWYEAAPEVAAPPTYMRGDRN